jgi:glycosyltransferase involved in cell wall biosynthesis
MFKRFIKGDCNMSKAEITPTVTIGMPVYNGEQYIREAIEDFLNQTYGDFELIITDNCSTDGTWEICQQYAAKDSRIRLHQHDENIGANRNFNSIVPMARGRYFKWAAHDDRVALTYLDKCVQLLDQDTYVVLANSYTQLIDKDGQVFHDWPDSERIIYDSGDVVFLGVDSNDRKIQSSNPVDRFFATVVQTNWNHDIFGLIRLTELKKIPLLENYYGTDLRILADLSLRGRYAIVPAALFSNRRHPDQSLSKLSSKEKLEWSNPNSSKSEVTHRWLRFRGFMHAILNSPISLIERVQCLWVLVRYYARFKRIYGMLEDLSGLRRYKIMRDVQEHQTAGKP